MFWILPRLHDILYPPCRLCHAFQILVGDFPTSSVEGGLVRIYRPWSSEAGCSLFAIRNGRFYTTSLKCLNVTVVYQYLSKCSIPLLSFNTGLIRFDLRFFTRLV